MRFQLLAKTMKWGSVVGLLLVATSWHGGANYRLLLDFVVSVAAIVVVKQAVRAKQYVWASGFVGMALLLNPIVPVFTPAGNLILLLFLIGLSPTIIIFAALRDATVRLYPNVVTEPYLQRELLIPTSDWAVV
jgi:uncharacterized protein DUF6804